MRSLHCGLERLARLEFELFLHTDQRDGRILHCMSHSGGQDQEKSMPKPNYGFEKRQRELEKKRKKAEKAEKKAAPQQPAVPQQPEEGAPKS